MLLEEIISVYDQDERRYDLTLELSSGGQGQVYRTRSSTDLVKLFINKGNALNEIARVRRMPLMDLPVARPMSLIDEPGGYTLQFQRDMDVVRSLKFAHINSVKDWWLDTGGLGRRVLLAAKIASIFELLHSRGLVYGDVSSNNIMVSKSIEYDEVSLIDIDNLFYFGEKDSWQIWTPTYSAPEVSVNASVPSFASDDFSLAVVLYEMITMVHPFMDGDSVKQAPTESGYYQDALHCMVPSVLDVSENNECLNYPIQKKEELLSSNLIKLFDQMFKNRNINIENRPRVGTLRLNLVRDFLRIIECEKCSWSYSLDNLSICPDCGNAEKCFRIKFSSTDGKTTAYEIVLGSITKTLDLSLLFPILQEYDRVKGSYVIDFTMLNRKIRAVPRRHEMIDIPRNISDSAIAKIIGLGEIQVEVAI
jgi:serine/threonine protein kinase